MAAAGWQNLVKGWPWFQGEGHYPLDAYSEFMPSPRLGRKPYGVLEPFPFKRGDAWGWQITEYEEAIELRPGMEKIAHQLISALIHLGSGRPTHGLSRQKLEGNPYWPPQLAKRAGQLRHERYVILLPLALSRTQDDKGRIRWTLFGASEQGPSRAFWRGFFSGPERELPEEQGFAFFRKLLHQVYAEPLDRLLDLRRAGFRILPGEEDSTFPYWREEPLPGWATPLTWRPGQGVRGVKYVLTFRPFGRLPASIQKGYLAGDVHLLPFPGSLVSWGAPPYRKLQENLPFAMQIPLLQLVGRHEGWHGIRVPQSGWMHEPRAGHEHDAQIHGPVRNTYKRTHRWARVLRFQDELAMTEREDKLAHVLFSALPDDVGLYGKPMARNAQLWTHDYRLLLNGPRATHPDLERTIEAVSHCGTFGYRFLFPAMRVGRHQVYWHRPLLAYQDAQTGEAVLLPNGPLGYLTAYDGDKPDLTRPIELWPRLLQREPHRAAVEIFSHVHTHFPFQTTLNVRKLLDTRQLLGDRPLPRSLARALLTTNKEETLDQWLDELPGRSSDPQRAQALVEELRGGLESAAAPLPVALTYQRTATRSFEINYWKTIASLAEGKYLTKNNADCVRDPVTQKHLAHHHRDLDALGEYLLAYYRKTAVAAGMDKRVLIGEIPFQWHTDFSYSWMGGWLNNQEGHLHERNLLVVIPGRDRSRAVIMADHYDTAYMEDRFEPKSGGDGARIAAHGADDNHSASAAMMLAAPIFLELARAGRLECDIWLVHLTGEEFPADCLGARQLCQRLVEGTLHIRLADGKEQDLSQTTIQGVYVSDMIAHNNDRDRDIFQMAPGTGPRSMWLAWQAHLAAEIWNSSVPQWNQRASRRGRGRGHRCPHGGAIPDIAEHLRLSGEVRPHYEPRSTLFNTDGQIFSDTGVPVVLFMENYDINRSGYHDSHDTMANIDLDYGAAVAAIVIESVARAATEQPPQ